MMEHYNFINGLCLEISSTTKHEMIRDGTFKDHVLNSNPAMEIAQIHFDFSHFPDVKIQDTYGNLLI